MTTKTRKAKCVICSSKKNLISHHKVHPIVRDASDETIPLCHRCHVDVHEAFHDSLKPLDIEKVGCFIYPVHKPRKWFGLSGGRLKKGTSKSSRKEEIAFYWAVFHYSYLDNSWGNSAIEGSMIRLPKKEWITKHKGITEEDVEEMKLLHAQGFTQKEIAKKFGIEASTVRYHLKK